MYRKKITKRKKYYGSVVRRTTPTKSAVERGFFRVSHGVLFGLTLFGIFAAYVVVMNETAVKGTEIRELEREIIALQERIEEQTVREAQLRSFVRPKESDNLETIKDADIRVIAVAQEREGVGQNAQQEKTVVAVAQ